MSRVKIIPVKPLADYKKRQPITLQKHFDKVKNTKITCGYALKISAVNSSQIEGNPYDVETYLRFQNSGMNTKKKEYKEIKQLEDAYNFARTHKLNGKNILKAHKMLSETFLKNKYRGHYRDKEVGVYNSQTGEKVFTGAKQNRVETEMDKLFHDIELLLSRKHTITEVFYYASMIHLILVSIHPFADGNGRISRLVEKWFLVEKLGLEAWFVLSEMLYQIRIKSYYKNLARCRSSYAEMNYNTSIPFLKMLPMALRIKN